MNEAVIEDVIPSMPSVACPDPAPSPAPERATLPPTPAPTQPVAIETAETSPWLARLGGDDGWAASARRAGVGLAMMLPFALATGLHTRAGAAEIASATLTLPVGLAMIALVGVAASTLGVSLFAAPLAPMRAAHLASRALFRAGVLLFGLAPITALWVAGGRWVEGLLVSTLAAFVAGASGIASIARGLVHETREADGTPHLGAFAVAGLFVLFALIVGARVWFPVCLTFVGGEP